MMSLRDKFFVTLSNNVTGLNTYTPNAFETTLAYPFALPGI